MYKQEMERLKNLFDVFNCSVTPNASDIESIVSFFNDSNPEEYDMRDAHGCAERVQEMMNELEEIGEEEYNYIEN